MEIAPPDPAAVAAFWAEFREAGGAAGGAPGEPADVFAFGDSAEMADELADLVLAGTKRATAGAVAEYDEQGWAPYVGAHSVVCRGDGTPVAVIRSTDVETGPISSVTEEFAWVEGEGDRTRDWWLEGHRAYFRRSFEAKGWPYDEDLPVVFERFELVWPPAAAADVTEP